VSLLVALLLASLQIPSGWEHIEARGWEPYVTASNGSYFLLMRPGPRRGLVWARIEYREPTGPGPYLSTRTLIELNCGDQQVRERQGDLFYENNLERVGTTLSHATSWRYAAPDTVEARYLEYGCGD